MNTHLEILVKELIKNGVSAKCCEIITDNEGNVSASEPFLDFSEHDKKVAEEKDKKIAELTEELWKMNEDFKKTASDNTALQAENDQLYERISDLEFGDNDRITELEKENSALEEKLSLIRTRVTEEARDFWDKDMFGSLVVTVPNKSNAENKINLNDRVKVKLTPLGVEIYYHQYDDLNKQIKANGGTPLKPAMPQIDKDGYTEFTLHNFINLYGKHIGMAKPNVIQPLNIVIV